MPSAVVTAVDVVDAGLRRELLACWTEVTNSGGAVGFVPPVTEDDVAPVLDALLDRVRQGRERLVVLTEDGALAGWAVLSLSLSPLRRHWATVLRVQVHPGRQGRGLGRVLLSGVHAVARDSGLEMLHLTVREGFGLERFYAQWGYREFGRMPGAIRLGPGDDREEVHLFVRL
ncbi:GNAT superfamily N-acetyltransferase [Geodermatophilus bullaregiensis]|uniref:GNAT family N-acetyltransferase n=1 Tax=Geodermatophilus bullaregiensis TaxID=1564160 RepID=UPI00195F072D|nr:GNAT family N-acetyltransferase [Geodermatophilus bullaregiensis]MBM7807561.1 GNAT superfamily N-acetyltransferase [Geodermatophilus bullaregiensis]